MQWCHVISVWVKGLGWFWSGFLQCAVFILAVQCTIKSGDCVTYEGKESPQGLIIKCDLLWLLLWCNYCQYVSDIYKWSLLWRLTIYAVEVDMTFCSFPRWRDSFISEYWLLSRSNVKERMDKYCKGIANTAYYQGTMWTLIVLLVVWTKLEKSCCICREKSFLHKDSYSFLCYSTCRYNSVWTIVPNKEEIVQ